MKTKIYRKKGEAKIHLGTLELDFKFTKGDSIDFDMDIYEVKSVCYVDSYPNAPHFRVVVKEVNV